MATKQNSIKKNWNSLSWNVPIMEVWGAGSDDFKIKGVAINETTTRNGVKYLSEELEKSVHTLRNKPILKDHDNRVDSIVGRTTENVMFDPTNRNIIFEGKIMDKNIQKMVSDGRINTVSIGAMVKDLEKSEGHDHEEVIARGIDFIELSLVAVPADPHATFDKAIMESFKIKNGTVNTGGNKMEEKILETKAIMPVTGELQVKESTDEVTKLQEELATLKQSLKDKEVADLKKQVAELKATKEKKTEIKEIPVKKEETKGRFITEDKQDERVQEYVLSTDDDVLGGIGIYAKADPIKHPRMFWTRSK